MSDYGDMCRDIRDARREARTAHGIPCPRCAEVRPKAHPSILLPEQRCRVDGSCPQCSDTKRDCANAIAEIMVVKP